MENADISFNPVLFLVAIVLTVMSSYTALDLFSIVKSSDKNKRFLFIGVTFSLGIGIWVMNFFGMLALNLTGSISYQIPMNILSILLGITLTGMAFFTLTNKNLRKRNLHMSSFFMTLAVLAVHMITIVSMNVGFRYQLPVMAAARILVYSSFFFSFWILFYSKSFSQSSHVWLKPLTSLVVTGAIVEGHLLLMRAASLYRQDNSEIQQITVPESLISYIILFVTVIILGGLISSSALISRRLELSDTNLKDITDPLNVSSIVAITDPRGNTTYVNHKFVEISQYTEEELMGRTTRY